MYKIVQRKNHLAVYALFTSKARAELWLKTYNPAMWMDKGITAGDLEIVEAEDD